MRDNRTKRMLREGKRVVGASTAMGSPEFVELAGKVGFCGESFCLRGFGVREVNPEAVSG